MAYVVHPFAMMLRMRKSKAVFPILVADADDVVGLVGSRLLIAALDNIRISIAAKVQVAVQSSSAVNLALPSLPQLPNVVASIGQPVRIASPRFSRNAARQFSDTNDALDCEVCERHREDDEAYWLNIADVCARFAVAVSKLNS